MKITKTKVTWIVGLLAAILTAAAAYMTSSCTASRTTSFDANNFHVDSISVNKSTHVWFK